MRKNKINPDFQKNNNNNISNQQLLNLLKYKLYPPPAGCLYENPKINQNLNFSSLEPILSKGKKILVGDGSFSKVFLYQHKISKIKYAIKIININSFMKKTNNKNLILDEINIQSKIFHPNIIRLFNYFKDKKNIYLILEFASKGTLFDYIHYKKGLDEAEAFYYFIQSVNSVSFLHKNKIIHRDIKPENLLINSNNILKLCDFGWSVYLHSNKRVTFCGTVEYMAPEIVKNEGYDFSIDVWSLGVLLYELIHSHSPFVVKDLNINEIENNILSKELRFKKGVSLECRDLIEKLLVKDAKNRIKIEDIYNHPFILKYINMMNGALKLSQINKYRPDINNNNKQIEDDLEVNKEKEENSKKEINEEIKESFSEFDTIPTEPEAAKIVVNFDKIIRQFTKIDNQNINNNKKRKIRNKIMNAEPIGSLDDKNKEKEKENETRHKKSLSLNNENFENFDINNLVNNLNNESKDKILQEKIIDKKENKENKKLNLNKENLLKLIIKKTTNCDNSNIKHKKFIKKTLIEEYNNNLMKNNNMNKNKIINKYIDFKINQNSSYTKNSLINSYIAKNKKNIFNEKLLGNLTDKNIDNNSKLDLSSKIILKNSKSISSFKNIKNNNPINDYSPSSKSNSSRKNNNKNIFKIKAKKNILTKKLNNLNKSQNNNNLFYFLKKPCLKNNYRNKFTLNLSNINVYNFCSPGLGTNSTKSFNQINTFIFMDKSREIKKQKSDQTKNYKNSPQTARLLKKKISKIFLSTEKTNSSNMINTNSNRTENSKTKKVKTNQKLYLNFSKINKYKDKRRELSGRNSKNKINNDNIIPSLYSNSKK